VRTLTLARQILAMTDHDQQLPRFVHANYGEAVGRAHQTGMAARPRLFGFADSQFRLSGQYLSGPMATPMKRSGSDDLTQSC